MEQLAGIDADPARLREAAYIQNFGLSAGNPYVIHLQSPVSIANYLRIADHVAARAWREQRLSGRDGTPRVLDWGAGFGQLSYLLGGRGCAVTSFDVGEPGEFPLPIEPTRTIRRTDHPSRLPYQDDSFDLVVSCGVLEHVEDHDASLAEIHRVLRPGGLLLIYNLPQRWGYIELIVRAFRLGYTHERRYGMAGTRKLLKRHGFAMTQARRSNMLPHNFRGLPAPLRARLTAKASALLRFDRALARLPLLNQLSGILEIEARRLTTAAAPSAPRLTPP
ncbi:MAG: class I SAM-dependent methyltransferase, partial [Chloroflexota bacterium]